MTSAAYANINATKHDRFLRVSNGNFLTINNLCDKLLPPVGLAGSKGSSCNVNAKGEGCRSKSTSCLVKVAVVISFSKLID